jgi:hypothetical protein
VEIWPKTHTYFCMWLCVAHVTLTFRNRQADCSVCLKLFVILTRTHSFPLCTTKLPIHRMMHLSCGTANIRSVPTKWSCAAVYATTPPQGDCPSPCTVRFVTYAVPPCEWNRLGTAVFCSKTSPALLPESGALYLQTHAAVDVHSQ